MLLQFVVYDVPADLVVEGVDDLVETVSAGREYDVEFSSIGLET